MKIICRLAMVLAVPLIVASPALALDPDAPTDAEVIIPPVNMTSFPTYPPEWGSNPSSGSGGTAIAARATHPRRAKRRRAKSATRPGWVTCGGYATTSTYRAAGTVASNGASRCNAGQSGGFPDLLAALGCIDLWSTGRYWTRLGCGNWRTSGPTLNVAHPTYERACTSGRYYRAANRMSMVHGNSASGEYYAYYAKCP